MSDSSPSDPRTFTHCIDGADRIIAVNESWLQFAHENSAPHLTRSAILKRTLWDFVSGVETQAIYEMVLKRVRTAKTVIRIPYRCDGADRRRFMMMEISPLSGGAVRISSRVTRVELRPPIVWPEPRSGAVERVIVACSWCRRFEAQPGRWVEIEEAPRLFGMDSDARVPAISHGICAECMAGWMVDI